MRHRSSKVRLGVWLVWCSLPVVFISPANGQDEPAVSEAVSEVDSEADLAADSPTTDDWVRMLHDEDASVRAKGIRGLSAGGGFDCLDELSKRLFDDDADVRGLTERAMWQVWFRSGSEKAVGLLEASMQSIQERQFDQAIKTLEAALEIDPDFAEAYNQRAIVHYFRKQYAKSIRDCKEAIKRNPYHFGAMSGMGQCYQQLRRPDGAIQAYERALRVNPNMEGVRKTLIQLLDADGKAIQA